MASHADGAARHVDILQPQRVQSAQAAETLRRLHREHGRRLPRFLHDTGRNAQLRQRGLLTSASRRRVREQRKALGRQAESDTVHVLIARVGFEENRAPALTSMDASGDFSLEPDATTIVEPPPHDAAYFEAQLLAMQSYYAAMSRGRLHIEGAVFPPAGDPSIKLTDVADYGPGPDGFWTIETLESYFRDAIALLDQESRGRFDLTPYLHDPTGERLGSIVIVHPGSDLQNDINRDSPNDLPTFFVSVGDSIPVLDGTREVRNGLVMPETASQDGALGGIQGALCHEFGHQLGLPDWYDTLFGLPVVGEWTLMDSGNAAFFAFALAGQEDEPIFALGLLPTSLGALDRIALGWEQPYVVRAPSDSVILRPATADEFYGDHASSAILPVSPEEYFLVENRRDVNAFRSSALGGNDVELCPYLNRDADTGVVLWMSKDDPTKAPRERHNTGEYDFWISSPTAPDDAFGDCAELGYGLIVWHVDERPLLEGLATNTVNTSLTHRALRVIEASGDFEIGDFTAPTVSFLGDGWNDPFRPGYKTELRQNSVPNNWNSDWALTGWEIVDITDAAPESRVLHVRALDVAPGWPQTFWITPDSLLRVEPRSALVANIGGAPALVAADSSAIHAFTPGGWQALFTGDVRPASLAGAVLDGESAWSLAALDGTNVWAWDLGGTAPVPRPGFPIDLGGTGERLLLLESGLGLAETADGAWLPFKAERTTSTAGAPLDLEAGVREAGVVVGDFWGDVAGVEIALVSGEAVEFRAFPVPGEAASLDVERFTLDFEVASEDEVFVAGGHLVPDSLDAQLVILRRDGRLRVVDARQGVLGSWSDLPPGEYVGMALADVDGDDWVDIVATSKTHVVGVNSHAAALFNTPRSVVEIFALRELSQITTAPVVADVTADALPEILFSTNLGHVYALDANGALVPGFPRKTHPDEAPAAMLAANLDADATAREVIGVTPVSAAVFNVPGGESEGSGWSAASGGPGRTRYAIATPGMVGDAGQRLQALERTFRAYPNPSRGQDVVLRIQARSDGPYEIRIYNLEGEQVFATQGIARAGAAEEVRWRVSGLASGTYLCRFVSPAAGVTSPLVEPITVVR
jgi:M6 family metalloprotease-like protein